MVMKHYPPEFRGEAVALYRSRPGATIKSVAEDLATSASCWCWSSRRSTATTGSWCRSSCPSARSRGCVRSSSPTPSAPAPSSTRPPVPTGTCSAPSSGWAATTRTPRPPRRRTPISRTCCGPRCPDHWAPLLPEFGQEGARLKRVLLPVPGGPPAQPAGRTLSATDWVAAEGVPRDGVRVTRQGISNTRPLRPLPQPITDPTQISRPDICRRPRIGGILNEYHHAA
jgi:hypothetical protein